MIKILLHRNSNYNKNTVKKYNLSHIQIWKCTHDKLYGIKLKSKMHGFFIVYDYTKTDTNGHKFYRIKFIDDEVFYECSYTSIINGAVKNHSNDVKIGNIYDSNGYGKFKILCIDGFIGNGTKTYTIQFIDTGTIQSHVQQSNIKDGKLKDPFFKSVYGIGYLGDIASIDTSSKLYRFLYLKWHAMIARCYNPQNPSYTFYGQKGIAVCDRWHNFSNFYNDCKLIDGYNEDKILSGELCIDKDGYYVNKNIYDKSLYEYSKDTCKWISQKDNNILIRHDNW